LIEEKNTILDIDSIDKDECMKQLKQTQQMFQLKSMDEPLQQFATIPKWANGYMKFGKLP